MTGKRNGAHKQTGNHKTYIWSLYAPLTLEALFPCRAIPGLTVCSLSSLPDGVYYSCQNLMTLLVSVYFVYQYTTNGTNIHARAACCVRLVCDVFVLSQGRAAG